MHKLFIVASCGDSRRKRAHMIAVSRSLIASEDWIATVEAALSTQLGQNLPLPRWSPSPLPAASEAAPNEAAARPVVDRLMMGMAGGRPTVAAPQPLFRSAQNRV